jgi:hypothetical protein
MIFTEKIEEKEKTEIFWREIAFFWKGVLSVKIKMLVECLKRFRLNHRVLRN